jgi:outer membrane protein assembly factor BamB
LTFLLAPQHPIQELKSTSYDFAITAGAALSWSAFRRSSASTPDEVVSAYKVLTGEPVWRHRDRARLDDPMGGPGPRATPTLGADRLFTFGSTGILNALDLATGTILWSRSAAGDLNAAVPTWGFSSSPPLVDDLVIVAVGGTLAAYGRTDGRPRWVGPAGGDSYSSPQAVTIDGVTQILLMAAAGTVSVAPATGEALWTHPWNARLPVLPIVQPARLEDGNVLLGDSTFGIRRLAATLRDKEWTVTERWASNSLSRTSTTSSSIAVTHTDSTAPSWRRLIWQTVFGSGRPGATARDSSYCYPTRMCCS